jgi:hypothetical protein
MMKGGFEFQCDVPPGEGDELYYIVFNQDNKVLTPRTPIERNATELVEQVEIENITASLNTEAMQQRIQNRTN